MKTSYRIDEKTIISKMIDLRYQDIREKTDSKESTNTSVVTLYDGSTGAILDY